MLFENSFDQGWHFNRPSHATVLFGNWLLYSPTLTSIPHLYFFCLSFLWSWFLYSQLKPSLQSCIYTLSLTVILSYACEQRSGTHLMSHFKDHASWLVCVKSGKSVGWFVGHIVKWGKESCLNFPPCTESSVFLSGEIWNGVEITICPPRLYCITVLLQSNDESPPLRLNGVSKLTLTVYSISKFVQRIVAFIGMSCSILLSAFWL